jgi:hypothetical protein
LKNYNDKNNLTTIKFQDWQISVLDNILNTRKEQLISKSIIDSAITTNGIDDTAAAEDKNKNKIAEQIIGIQKIIDLIKQTE